MSKYFTFDSISTPVTATKGYPVDYDFVVRNMTPVGTQDCIVFLFNDPSSPSVVSVLDKFDIYPGDSMDITTTQHIPHDGTYHGSGKLKYLEVGTYKLQFRACYPNYYTGEIVVDEVKDFTVIVTITPELETILMILGSENGVTNPVAGEYHFVKVNNIIQPVQAIANSGYVLDSWTLDGANAGKDNPIKVVMNNNHSLQANFTGSTPPNGGDNQWWMYGLLGVGIIVVGYILFKRPKH